MTLTNEDELVTEEVRCHIEKLLQDLEIKNYTMDVSAGTVRGDNYLGIIAKVQVKGENKDDKNVTLNLIVKSAPRTGGFREFAPVRKAYDREIYVYSKVFPEFTKLQEERCVLKPFTSFAKYYASTMDVRNEALIMEDMKCLGFELRDRHYALDYNHISMVLREYGRFHALSFAVRDQKPELFQELADNTQEAFFSGMQIEEFSKSVRMQSDRALHALDPVKERYACERFKSFQDNMIEYVRQAVQSDAAGKHAVINHGDCWMNNILFKYENISKSKVPTGVCFLDWQLSRLGSPALDLSYFLFTCSDKAVRDEHYEHLIREYHDSFSSFLRQLGSDPDKLFPFEVLQEHLKKYSLFGLYMAVMVLFVMTSEADEIPDISALSDMTEVMEKFQYDSKNIDRYNSRISGVILDFIKYNYDF